MDEDQLCLSDPCVFQIELTLHRQVLDPLTKRFKRCTILGKGGGGGQREMRGKKQDKKYLYLQSRRKQDLKFL